MRTSAAGFLLGGLVLAFCLPLVVTLPKTLAIPKKLQQAVGRVIVNATSCTVTCGLGYKEETVCEVGPDGVRRKCTSQRLECLTNWICGMLHFTILIGKEFELSCLSSDILEVGKEAFRFTWRLARGIISTDDEIFKPFRASSHFVRFESIQEYDSGTYRCDVQLLRNLRFVKRLYFGLRVLPPNLVKLNFHQSLTEHQKLVDKGLEVNLDNGSKPHGPPWKKKVAVALGIGITSGMAGGVLVIIALGSGLRLIYSSAGLESFRASLRKGWLPRNLDLFRKAGLLFKGVSGGLIVAWLGGRASTAKGVSGAHGEG
ncbi:transmembrane protein 81 [Callorhinus ursinus]|uniref:Transmembrane protein 81 n=1 Tax=Callorhinus ursinus TaxID=34884 RepID=A0A3Q7MSZ2_CALUR|nr:transmembrane protein 81 [Callorhinus ursinus]